VQRRTLVILLLVFVGLRVVLGLLPGYPPDLETFKRWAVWGALNGVHTVYDKGSNFDYPPLYAFILTPFGAIEEELRPSYARQFLHIPRDRVTRIDYSPVFSLLVKIPPLLFDLLMAVVVALLVHRYGLWRWSRDWGGWLPASMILFHPAILYVSGYMGQPDSVHTSLTLLALTLILLRHPELGWAAAALACMTKPLAAPYLPLLALATVMRMGFKRSCTAALASWATLALVFTPFMLTGRIETAFQRIFGDWDLLPLTSVNGHNLWWLVGGWQSADEPMLGFPRPG
jgi:Gpi18-like mannosyltransferase